MNMSRRNFMMSAAVAMAAGNARPAKAASANEVIQTAVIGCRNRGSDVGSTMGRSEDFNVITLCDCDEAMIAKAMKDRGKNYASNVKFEQDFRRVLENPDVDAVVLGVPDHWHAKMTVMALDAGKHVYVEKPASYNIQDGKDMVQAQKAHPELVVQVGTQQRSAEHFRDAHDFVAGGGLGTVGFGRAWIAHRRDFLEKVPDSDPPATMDYDLWTGPAPMHPYNEKRVHYNWHFVRDYGTGETGNWGAHWLDSLRHIAGLDLPTAAMGCAGQYVMKDIKEWPDTQTVIFDCPGVSILWEARLWTKYGVQGMGGGVEIGGEKGSLLIDRGGWRVIEPDGKITEHKGGTPDSLHVKNFAAAIREGAPLNAPIEEGHKSAIWCHLANIVGTIHRSVAFDTDAQSIVNDSEAEAMMSREYRAPWNA